MIDNTHEIELQKQWHEKFPSTLSGLFAFYQCLCTITILGCELGSILIDIFNATIYVGFWASIVFMIAWISQVVAISCRSTRRCATCTLVLQCIALFFSVCVIGFDVCFIVDPTTCFFSKLLCNSTAPVRGIFYSKDHFDNIKIPLIKGQLGAAAVMFAFCIDYIIIYTTTFIQIKKYQQSILQNSNQGVSNPIRIQDTTDVLITNESNLHAASLPAIDFNISTSSDYVLNTSLNDTGRQSRWSFDSYDLNPIKI